MKNAQMQRQAQLVAAAQNQAESRAVCPSPAKKTYWTKGEAKRAITRMRGRQGKDRLHAYRCLCGRFHVGRRAEGAKGAW